MMYEVMMPFLSSCFGGCIDIATLTLAAKLRLTFVGGPSGTVDEKAKRYI